MKARLKSWLIIVVSLLAGFYLLYTGGIDLLNSTQLSSKGIIANGEVKSIKRHKSGGSSTRFYTTVEFKDHKGSLHILKNKRPYGYLFVPEKGQSVEVVYLKHDPGIAVINSFWQKFFAPALSLAVGMLFVWFARSELFDKRSY